MRQPCATTDAWMTHKAEEINEYADCNEITNFFNYVKAIFVRGTAPSLFRMEKALDGDLADSEALGQASQLRPQPLIHDLSRC
ncbi:unnamed protein product [Schistocephalus solidus]|uniref:Helitron_like_N domain-containing protein n=1 Tax=Schistocephalus solidus TaxID=70667 RepID=A0A183TMM9_SCHSO|nr:unnamed protein product [Schistocephalus solidus]